jgi:hypothetical protein
VKGSRRGGWAGRGRFDRLIGLRLRRERRLAGMTEEELGDALDVGGEAVRACEGGEMCLPPDRLVAATAVLGVPLFLLFYPSDQSLPSNNAETECPQRLAVRRPVAVLDSPGFAKVLPITTLWQEKRGQLDDDVHRAILDCGMFHRTVLLRRSATSSRLITEHLGAGIMILRPCEALAAIGRYFGEDVPDRDYGAWVAQAYDEVLCSRRLRVESVRASVRTSAATILQTRYDRVLMPWRSASGDVFAMGLSIQREVPTVM